MRQLNRTGKPFPGNKVLFLPSLLLIALFTFSSACTPRQGLLVKPEEFRNEIRSVTVIPLYLDGEMIPTLPESWHKFDLPREYRNRLREMIAQKAQNFDRAASAVLGGGRYALSVQEYKGGIRLNSTSVFRKTINPVFPISPRLPYRDRNSDNHKMYWWKYNYRYQPEKTVIREIAREQGTDGVWFHNLQVIIPGESYDFRYQLVYEAALYDRTGTPVYKKVYSDSSGYTPTWKLELTEKHREQHIRKGGSVAGFLAIGVFEATVEAAMKHDLPNKTTYDEWSRDEISTWTYTLPLPVDKLDMQELDCPSLMETMRKTLNDLY